MSDTPQLPKGFDVDKDPIPVTAKGEKLKDNDRLTAQLHLAHQTTGEDPSQVMVSFSHLIPVSGDEPYSRRADIKGEWTPLDTGWVTQPGHLVLRNITSTGKQVKADEDEKRKLQETILEIFVGATPKKSTKGHWKVLPGRFFVGDTCDASRVWVRAKKHTVKLRIHVIPGDRVGG